MGSGYAGVYESRKGRKNAEQQANDAKNEESLRQQKIDGNIKKIREMFGVDDETAGADNTVSQTNKQKLDGWLDEYGGAVTEANNVDLDDKFTAASTSNRWILSDRGLLGGSADAAVQRNQISELVAGRQRAVAAGRDATRSAQSTLTNQRLNLEGQAAAGTNLNMDFKGIQQQTDMGLDTARTQIVPTAIGNSITTIGQGVGMYQANQGGRNITEPTPRTTNSSTSGTITGTR
jgi:hypothetical protein